MRVHFIVHESFEAPGTVEDWARDRGHTLAFSRVYLGDPLPCATDLDLLVVMGGPQSVRTTPQECAHFDSAAEQRLISECVHAGAAVAGVCLGAQLIGAALGAQPEPTPQPEIGAFPISLTAQGRRHPLLAGLEPTFTAGHWHTEMPGLTADAVVLATSAGCPRQIVGYGPHVLALQLHLELTPRLVDTLAQHSVDQLQQLEALPFIQAAGLRDADWAASRTRLYGILDRLVADHQGGAA